MGALFELRLQGGRAADGELDVKEAIEILTGLQELATRIGRIEADEAITGRPSERVERLSRLRFKMVEGSTVLQVHRTSSDDTLAFALEEERHFDESFAAAIEGVRFSGKPAGTHPAIADSTLRLIHALQRAADTVTFSVDGEVRTEFATREINHRVWQAEPKRDTQPTMILGRLEMVDLKSEALRIRDDVDNTYVLPRMARADHVGALIGQYVTASGLAERAADGRIRALHNASVAPHVLPAELEADSSPPKCFDEMLLSTWEQASDGIEGVSDEEWDAFLAAVKAAR